MQLRAYANVAEVMKHAKEQSDVPQTKMTQVWSDVQALRRAREAKENA